MSNSICIQHSSVNDSLIALTGGFFLTTGNSARRARLAHSPNIPQQASHACVTVETEFRAIRATTDLDRCFRQYLLRLAGVSGVVSLGTTGVTGPAAAVCAASGVTGTGTAAAAGTAPTDAAAVAAATAARASAGTASLSVTAGGGASATSPCSAAGSSGATY